MFPNQEACQVVEGGGVSLQVPRSWLGLARKLVMPRTLDRSCCSLLLGHAPGSTAAGADGKQMLRCVGRTFLKCAMGTRTDTLSFILLSQKQIREGKLQPGNPAREFTATG